MSEETKKEVQPAPPDFAKLIGEALTQQLAGLPALVEQSVAKQVAALTPKPEDKKSENKKPEEDKIDWKQTVADLQKKDQERDAQLAQERARSALATAVAGVPFFDPQDAIRELLPKVQIKEGKHVFPGTQIVLGKELPADLSLEDAAKQLGRQKPHWVKSDVKGGTGAGGSTTSNTGAVASHDFTQDPTYDELMDPANGKLLVEFQDKHPERFARVQRDGLLRLQKGK